MTLHSDDPARFARAEQSLDGGYDIGERGDFSTTPLVLDRLA